MTIAGEAEVLKPEISRGLWLTAFTLGIGLFSLGCLIGTLMAMSAQSLAKDVIAGLFALLGGSLLAFLQKLSADEQIKAAIGVFAISVGALIGVYSGLAINEHQLLTPPSLRKTQALADTKAPDKYLRSVNLSTVNAIDQQFRTGLPAKEAYEKLHAEVLSSSR